MFSSIMALAHHLPLQLLCIVYFLCSSCRSASGSLQSVPELEAAMYKTVDGTACVQLLTLSGEIGCANPGRSKVAAPIVRMLLASDDLDQEAVVLLPYLELGSFLKRTLDDVAFSEKVTGLLVEYPSEVSEGVHTKWGLSDDETFPQANFAPYANKSYVWNPLGSGVLNKGFDFPVYLLSKDDTKTLQKVAVENERRSFEYPVKVAEMDIVMQTTKLGTTNSDSCLKEWSCLPLGGYSVWSSLPPINASGSSEKPLVLAISSMDSASIFRDKISGADSPLSGMIALLAAVDALANISSVHEWDKQLVIALFNGEAWGYLGSRRFLLELSNEGISVQGLNRSLIHQVLEISSVGQAVENTFYVHSQSSGAGQGLLDALQVAATSLAINVQVKAANQANPGIPPSSLMSFVQENESLAGAVLAEFDSTFLNQYFHSVLDDAGRINVSTIVVAASLVARTLYLLVKENATSIGAELDSIVVNSSLIEELVGCLLTCDPGMSCSLVSSLITPIRTCPSHYVGIFPGDPSAQPIIDGIDDTPRFVWNFLGNRTAAVASHNTPSECSTECSTSGEICIGSTVEHKGVCAVSTTRYVPAYSTRLQYETSGWQVIKAASDDTMGNVDPVYTESYWKTLGVKVYAKESTTFDKFIFVMGLAMTVGSYFVVLSTKAVFQKRLKNA